MNFREMLLPVPEEAKLQSDDSFTWGGSMVRDASGVCHLFYSRWPHEKGFEAWVTHSEIAHAISDKPTGPYRHADVALPMRGAEWWDGLCTHNPTVHAFNGKYYLYYMGNTGDGKNTKGINWTHRNNQRIGVAEADRPDGPWKRFDHPLIDVGADDQADDALMTCNPTIARRPDGIYWLIYKCAGKHNPLPFGGPVVHKVATSNSPIGPFMKHPIQVFTVKDNHFPAEDPCLWAQGDGFWAIVKDMHGAFTGAGRSLLLFQSDDGMHWKLAATPLVATPEVNWERQGLKKLERLERPQVWLEDGIPAVLFCAAKDGDQTFNVHIPLRR